MHVTWHLHGTLSVQVGGLVDALVVLKEERRRMGDVLHLLERRVLPWLQRTRPSESGVPVGADAATERQRQRVERFESLGR